MALIHIQELHLHVNLTEVSKDAKEILSTVTKIFNQMATKEQFQAAFDQITSAVENIAADIQRLTESLQTGGLSEADENEVLTKLQDAATRLQTIADSTPENPPVEPTPEA